MSRWNQTKQFDTFDTLEDRREMVILFEKLGAGLPELQANDVRAKFLRMVVLLATNGVESSQAEIDPSQCHPAGAYMTFVHLVGVLLVPMADVMKLLEKVVSKKMWLTPFFQQMLSENVSEAIPADCFPQLAFPAEAGGFVNVSVNENRR